MDLPPVSPRYSGALSSAGRTLGPQGPASDRHWIEDTHIRGWQGAVAGSANQSLQGGLHNVWPGLSYKTMCDDDVQTQVRRAGLGLGGGRP